MISFSVSSFFFFFNDTATTEIYTLSLHDALPISPRPGLAIRRHDVAAGVAADVGVHLEAVAGEDRGHGPGELGRAGRVVPRADDHLVVLHPPRTPGVAVEEERVAVVPGQLA